jgi:predicted AlkP superfamily phosphohydrolase/phosphomutase
MKRSTAYSNPRRNFKAKKLNNSLASEYAWLVFASAACENPRVKLDRAVAAGILALFAAIAPGCNRSHPSPDAGSAARAAASPVESDDVGNRPPRPPGSRAPVIWLGLDGLDWDFMDRLSAEGLLPNWRRLTSLGSDWKLKSFMPILSPVVWTTIATGVGPDVHGVLDFQEIDPATGRKVPVSGFSRRVPAVWNIASARGLKVGVVGWWATHPAEQVNGFFVSDHASPILFPASGAGTAFPPTVDGAVAAVTARDGKITAPDLTGFLDVPPREIAAALSSGEGMENRIVALSRILAATRVTQRLARELYDRERPDLTAVYFEGTDEIGHVFAPFTPPRLGCVSDADYARYHRAAEAYFAIVDAILGQWMRRAREDGATLLVNSDHGFTWGEGRTCDRSSFDVATAAFWHRMEGVLVAWGAGVTPSTARAEASVFDMAPTVLSLLGLPVDPNMSGKPLSAAFRELRAPRRENLLGSVAVRRVAAPDVSSAEADEYARKLRALGYLSGSDAVATAVAPPGGSRPGTTDHGHNNLGLFERDTAGNLARAEAEFRKALEIRPGYAAPMFNLAVLSRTRGDDGQALEWLFRSFAAGQTQPEETILHWAAEYQNRGRERAEKSLLVRGASAYPQSEKLGRALANQRLRRRDCRGARDAVARFADSSREFQTLNALGVAETCLGQRGAAAEFFRRSLALRPAQPGVEEALAKLEGKTPAPGSRK